MCGAQDARGAEKGRARPNLIGPRVVVPAHVGTAQQGPAAGAQGRRDPFPALHFDLQGRHRCCEASGTLRVRGRAGCLGAQGPGKGRERAGSEKPGPWVAGCQGCTSCALAPPSPSYTAVTWSCPSVTSSLPTSSPAGGQDLPKADLAWGGSTVIWKPGATATLPVHCQALGLPGASWRQGDP